MGLKNKKTTYPSKRDPWIVVLLWAGAAILCISAGSLWQAQGSLAFRLVLSVLMIAVAGFILWILYATHYTLTNRDLIIRSGPFCWTVPIDSITEVYPTRNPLSSPACSLDRLYVRHGHSRFGIMISPQNKGAFLRDLSARSGGLKLEGDRISREP